MQGGDEERQGCGLAWGRGRGGSCAKAWGTSIAGTGTAHAKSLGQERAQHVQGTGPLWWKVHEGDGQGSEAEGAEVF